MDINAINEITNGFIPQAAFRTLQGPNAAFVQGHFDTAQFLPDLFPLLNIQEPKGFDNMAKKRQADYLAGRIMAKLALSEMNATTTELPIGDNRAPIWPIGLNGSLSHSKGLACCMVTNDHNTACGVDIEHLASASASNAILKKCLNDAERDWLSTQTNRAPDLAATLIFSGKESIFKAYHRVVGRFFGFESAQVIGGMSDHLIQFELTEDLHPTLPKGYQVPIHFEIQDNTVLTWILTPLPRDITKAAPLDQT